MLEQAADPMLSVVTRLRDAMNEHDLEALVDVFDPDFVSETPAHPQRTFRGADQVRRNWEQIFAGVPDLQADLLDAVVEGDTVWSEWDWHGTRRDGCAAPDAWGDDPARQGFPRGLGPFLHGARRRGRSRGRRSRAADRHRRRVDGTGGAAMILVAGGTGMLGRSLIPLLAGHGEPIRVLTRGGRPSPQLALPGIETAIGDVRDPETLRRAMVGVRTVISAINGFGGDGALGVKAIDRDGNVNLIDAAEAAGVEHFVLVSIQQAAADHPIELFRMKAAAEQRLRASRMAWTMVRPTAYQETWLEIVGRPLVTTGSTRVFGRGQNPINFVSAGDVARIVDVAVTDPALRGQSVDVQGPENLTFDEFVETVRATTGATGTVNHVPLPMLRLMSLILRPIKPVLAGQMAAAVVMDTRDMTADTTERARRFPHIPSTPLREVAARQLRPAPGASTGRPPVTQP